MTLAASIRKSPPSSSHTESSAVCGNAKTPTVGSDLWDQYLRDLALVDSDDCFFSAMGRLARERTAVE
jgi:hypothetical protein